MFARALLVLLGLKRKEQTKNGKREQGERLSFSKMFSQKIMQVATGWLLFEFPLY